MSLVNKYIIRATDRRAYEVLDKVNISGVDNYVTRRLEDGGVSVIHPKDILRIEETKKSIEALEKDKA